MHRIDWPRRVGVLALTLSLLALSGSMAWATAHEYRGRGLVPNGVAVQGIALGGMTESQAREAIHLAVAAPLMRPVTVTSDAGDFVFDPAGAVSVDVDGMIAQAYAPRRNAPFASRLSHDLLGADLGSAVEPLYSVDETAAAEWLNEIAPKIDRAPVDATLSVVDGHVKIAAEKPGRAADIEQGLSALKAAFASENALADGARVAELPVEQVEASVTASSFGQTIVVRLSERRVRLFEGERLVKTYRCAIGKPTHPTPTGVFDVTAKRYMPTWGNPGSEWAKNMPATIPPGPGNPLGTRAINLSASGIRFHGTSDVGSIGTAASHGCMRMVRADIEDFYDKVVVGTKVHIIP